jgi:preprotein translocase subunit SecE
LVGGSIPLAPATNFNFFIVIKFFNEVVEETKKLVFPTKKETYITTVTILVTIVVFSLAIVFADFVISKIIGLIFGL